MTAGIIHEVNNPLNYVKTTLYTLRRRLDPGSPGVREMLEDIQDGVDRVQGIVTSLRTFSHPSHELRKEESVESIVGDALRLVSHETRGSVTIETSIPPGLRLLANRNQITQVLVNLLQNSLDALKQRGERADTPFIRIEAVGEGICDKLILRDNGCGIPPRIPGPRL